MLSSTKRPLNIAIFTDTYFPQINGVVTSTYTFAQEFRKLGHRVVIFAPNSGSLTDPDPDLIRFPAISYPFQKEYVLALPFLSPIRNFSSYRFDIVHIQTPFSMGLYGLKLAQKAKIPVVHTYHTFFERYLHYLPILPASWLVSTARSISRRFCNQFNIIFAPSTDMKLQLEQYDISKPIEVIPTGIDPVTILDSEKTKFLSHFNLQLNDQYVIYAGRLGKEKNVYFMLDAFFELANRFPDLKLMVVGDGPEYQGMFHKVKEAKFENRVIFTGYLSRKEVFMAFSNAILYLFPSTTETQGLTLLECFNVGTPAVCINSMGTRYLMPKGLEGALVNENRLEFVDAAAAIIANPQLRHEKSTHALARATAFSASKIAESVIQVYRRYTA